MVSPDRRAFDDAHGVDWLLHAHGLFFFADSPIAEALPARSYGEPVNRDDFILRKSAGTRMPEPSHPEWVTRQSGGISVAIGEYGTQLEYYCRSRALALARDDYAKQPRVVQISRGRVIGESRFNHATLRAFLLNISELDRHIVLHSICVIIRGEVFLFVGNCGIGELTLAAGFASRCYPLFAEDIVLLATNADGYAVDHPSYPGARLRAKSFLLPKEKRLNTTGRFGLPKHRVQFGNPVEADTKVGVAGAYFSRSASPVGAKIESLTAITTIKPLLRSSFVAVLSKANRSREAFVQTKRLVRAFPACERRYKRSADHFERLLDTITAHAEATTTARAR